MFCLDYGVAFFLHYHIIKTLNDNSFQQLQHKCVYDEADLTQAPSPSPSPSPSPLVSFGTGALAGTGAAVALYPFDLVRQMTVTNGRSSFAFGTIPFMTVYLGLYLMHPRSVKRESDSSGPSKWKEKLKWAIGATTIAAMVELPFDYAKISMMSGSIKNVAIAAALRVPLGSALLIMYDQILEVHQIYVYPT